MSFTQQEIERGEILAEASDKQRDFMVRNASFICAMDNDALKAWIASTK